MTPLKSPVRAYQVNSYRLDGTSTSSSLSNQYDHVHGGLFLTIARINHSCRPNVLHCWRPDLQQTVIHAIGNTTNYTNGKEGGQQEDGDGTSPSDTRRMIHPGDELLTCYGPVECRTTSERRAYLQEHLSFWCECAMCREGNDYGGDDRMREIGRLHEEIRDQLADLDIHHHHHSTATTTATTTTTLSDPTALARTVLESVETCRSLLRQQGLDTASGTIKSLLRYGYQAARNHLHDNDLALSYLVDLRRAVGIGEGKSSPNYLEIEGLIRDCASS
mmetsp:Transcript_26442/g.73002  ORF Transcript_26442/g.73002 Transcript_26442/m.73002 type:complete len:276 (-) Transcript_26442:210-1037(-)